MNCKEVSELSPLLLSGELDSRDVQRHLETCPACAAEMQQLRELDGRVRETIAAEPLDTVAIEQRVRAQIGVAPRRWMGIAASIAAAIVIASAGYRVWTLPDRLCADAAADHRREVVEGAHRTWRSDPASIAELSERQGLATLPVAQMAPEGFRFEKARLCRLDGRVFIHLVYSSNAGNVSVFVRQRGAGAVNSIRDVQSGADHVAYFDTEHVSAIVVSDRSRDSALDVARAAERIL